MEVKPGYKRTEVGVIPEDWALFSLSSLSAFITKGSTPTTYGFKWEQSGILFLRSECVSENGLDLSQSMFISDAAHASLRRSEVNKGDLLVTITGNVGRVVLYRNSGPANINQHIARIRIISTQASSEFIYHYLTLPQCRWRFNSIITGQAYPQISLKQVRDTNVPIPPTKDEREAIAKALSDADALIESLEQLITKKHHIKQGTMQELLRPKEGWVKKRLGNTAVLKARIGWQGLTTSEYLDTGDFYLITGTDFKGGYIDWSNCHYVAKSRYKQDKNIQLKEHDVVVTKDGTIGKVALITHLEKPATLNSGVFVIRPIEDAFHPDFFYYLLCSNLFTGFLNQLSAGSTINHLYQKDFVNFNYMTPVTTDEQISIAAILSDMDAEIAALEEKLAKSRLIKQGMMQELLTGRIRLVDPSAAKAKHLSPLSEENAAAPKPDKRHNWAFNEAVVISVLVDQFAKPEFPLGRKRYTKLSYLMHRKAEQDAQGYLKKAAGPYNPRTKYAGPEKIAQENCYMRMHENGKFKGFVVADKIELAKSYFTKWYGSEITTWLEQFRYKSNDELECLATVDMVMQELLKQGKTVTVDSIRALIASEPEWLPKLERPVFSDSGIAAALAECHALFPS